MGLTGTKTQVVGRPIIIVNNRLSKVVRYLRYRGKRSSGKPRKSEPLDHSSRRRRIRRRESNITITLAFHVIVLRIQLSSAQACRIKQTTRGFI